MKDKKKIRCGVYTDMAEQLQGNDIFARKLYSSYEVITAKERLFIIDYWTNIKEATFKRYFPELKKQCDAAPGEWFRATDTKGLFRTAKEIVKERKEREKNS